jgi:hypothetical protein
VVLKGDQHTFVACHQLDFSKPELHAYRPAIIDVDQVQHFAHRCCDTLLAKGGIDRSRPDGPAVCAAMNSCGMQASPFASECASEIFQEYVLETRDSCTCVSWAGDFTLVNNPPVDVTAGHLSHTHSLDDDALPPGSGIEAPQHLSYVSSPYRDITHMATCQSRISVRPPRHATRSAV